MSSFPKPFAEPEPEENPPAKKPASFFNLFEDPDAPAGEPEPAAEVPCALKDAFREDRVFWAMHNIPIREATRHFLVCGTTGSGKTTAIRLFLQSIANRFHKERGCPEQLIVFDAKGDMIPILAGLGLKPTEENVCIMNPFDARSKVWNFADGVQEPAMARHLATLLIPERLSHGERTVTSLSALIRIARSPGSKNRSKIKPIHQPDRGGRACRSGSPQGRRPAICSARIFETT
jgi:Type IV secretion-system coupling protein DNA-binding domain